MIHCFLATKYKIFKDYPRYTVICKYLAEISRKYPERVRLVTAGFSYEDRKIQYVHISNNFAENRNVIFIDAGAHGREWLSISTALYCIYMLAELPGNNDELLHSFDWIILPLVNPDGYEYTHDVNRRWRKTRKPTSTLSIGTDCNRNFDFHWDQGCSSPTKITYRGDKPFSEPETVAVREIMNKFKDRCKLYISLHSHAKSILYPWGFSKTMPPEWKELHALANVGVNAIKSRSGSIYRLGTISRKFRRLICGGSCDYAFGCVQIPYAICFELAGGCFNPSSKLIPELTKESWCGIKAMAEYIISKYHLMIPQKKHTHSIAKILKSSEEDTYKDQTEIKSL